MTTLKTRFHTSIDKLTKEKRPHNNVYKKIGETVIKSTLLVQIKLCA